MKIRLSKALVVGEGEGAKKLSVSVTEDDETFEAIDAKVEDLTGSDVEFCLREAAAAKQQPILLPRYDVDFQIQVAAKASGIEAAALKKLPIRDYLEVAQQVQGFLTS